jgi:hypothetical protein
MSVCKKSDSDNGILNAQLLSYLTSSSSDMSEKKEREREREEQCVLSGGSIQLGISN